jgi:hypothetical protein
VRCTGKRGAQSHKGTRGTHRAGESARSRPALSSLARPPPRSLPHPLHRHRGRGTPETGPAAGTRTRDPDRDRTRTVPDSPRRGSPGRKCPGTRSRSRSNRDNRKRCTLATGKATVVGADSQGPPVPALIQFLCGQDQRVGVEVHKTPVPPDRFVGPPAILGIFRAEGGA